MKNDPYLRPDFLQNTYQAKVKVEGRLVVVLQGYLGDRALSLIKQKSRALLKGEIHELILTDELTAGAGQLVNNIAYLAFLEINAAGVIIEGDGVYIQGKKIGTVAGFDTTHMPNHLNIVLKNEKLLSGTDWGMPLEDKIEIY